MKLEVAQTELFARTVIIVCVSFVSRDREVVNHHHEMTKFGENQFCFIRKRKIVKPVSIEIKKGSGCWRERKGGEEIR